MRDTATGALGRKHCIKQFRDVRRSTFRGSFPFQRWGCRDSPQSLLVGGGGGQHRGESRNEKFAKSGGVGGATAFDGKHFVQLTLGQRFGSGILAIRAHSVRQLRGLELARFRELALFA